jgi:hypothetical protein
MDVSPSNLFKLEAEAGRSLYTSPYWINKECIRILALSGYKISTYDSGIEMEFELQEKWMKLLGKTTY